MEKDNTRDFNCRDEELPVIANFILFSMNRDIADFTAFSPKFNAEYLNGLETKIKSVSDLVEPESETLAKKLITERLRVSTEGLTPKIDYVAGYLALASDLQISDAAFGISALRKSIRAKDAESIVDKLDVLLKNVDTYKSALMGQGMSDELINELETTAVKIASDRQKQYEIGSNRKILVQNNIGELNELYAIISEIMKVGKILYRKDAAKVEEYTFVKLRNKIRRVSQPSGKE